MKLATSRSGLLSLVPVFAWLLVPTTARAATITIDDLTDTTTLSWSGFEYGFSVNGGPASTDGSVDVPEIRTGLSFFGGWITGVGVPVVVGGGSFGFIEPDTGLNSDFLHVSTEFEFINCPLGGPGCASIAGDFISDVAGTTLGVTPGIPEPVGYYDVTSSFPGLPGDLTIKIRSDADAVPEPASLLLLGTGLLGGLRRWRKQRLNGSTINRRITP